jgi:tRNA(Ile)-lysidine synthase
LKKNVKPTIVNHLAKKFAGILNSKIVLDEKDRIIVAVSGGPDSVALLFLLKELPKKIAVSAVYVDHGLRPGEIPQEIELIERHCIELDYPFYVRQVDVKGRYQSTGESPEAAARILRYEILEEIRHELHAKYIAVGHTADDQVEQFFIRLIRGTGRDGLSGMDYQNGFIIRPLLDETKKSLVAYLDARGVKYCTDSSNKERNFLRNRVRLDLLPLLEKEFTPAIRTKILQLMEIIRVEEAFLAAQTEAALTECVEIAADKIGRASCRERVS